jgi:outer membrane protein TolC
MRGSRFNWRRYGLHLIGGVAAPALLALTGSVVADEPALAPVPAAAAPVASPALDLHACRQIALEKQPTIAAARASLAAANMRLGSLDNLRFAGLIKRDLPIRKQQAALGVEISQAAVTQAEWDAIHGVTYTYLAALYAQEQLAVADKALDDLKSLQDVLKQIINDPMGRKDVSQRNVDQLDVHLLGAKGRREEAVEGLQRALSGLREAMGVGPDYPLTLADNHLPSANPVLEKDKIVALTLARRGEMIQAVNAAQVTCFEIEAQKKSFLPSAQTFASGSDTHLQPIPQAGHDAAYKPGGIGIEMPATMNGHRSDRVEQARDYHSRAEAVVEKTHNLLTLEAEQVYFRWVEASKKLPYFLEASDKAEKVRKDLTSKFDAHEIKVSVDEMLNGGMQATEYRLLANQTHYELLQALAALERITAGGFNPGLEKK